MSIITLRSTQEQTQLLNPLLMWFIATLFSFLQFYLQIVSNTMTDQLMQSFNISPAELGLLSSAFFYPFIAMQIPAGYLLGKYSTRRVLALAALCTAMGAMLFGLANHLSFALLARALMGLGAGCGFLGMLTVTRTWFALRFFSFMVGVSELIAMILTAISEKGTVALVEYQGWRFTLFMIAGFSLFVAFLLFVFIRDKPPSQSVLTVKFFDQLYYIIRQPMSWFSGIYGCGMFAVVTAFSALWGLKFLSVIYSDSPEQAASGIGMVFFGLAVGCPAAGLLVAKTQKPRWIMGAGALISLLASLVLIFPAIGRHELPILVLLFILGFACGTYYLCYEIAATYIRDVYKSIAMGFCSMLVMIGAIILQPLMGAILETMGFDDNADLLSLSLNAIHAAFQVSMLPLVLMQLIALLMVLLMKHSTRL